MGAVAELDEELRTAISEAQARAAADARSIHEDLGALAGSADVDEARARLDVAVTLAERSNERGDGGAAASALAAARLRMAGNELADELAVDECRDRIGLWTDGSPQDGEPLRPGPTCLVDPDLLAELAGGGTADETTLPEPSDCAEPHDAVAYLTFEARPVLGEDFPGEIALAEQAAAQCPETWRIESGGATDGSLTFSAALPTAEQWGDGVRSVTCLRFDPAGDRLGPVEPATDQGTTD